MRKKATTTKTKKSGRSTTTAADSKPSVTKSSPRAATPGAATNDAIIEKPIRAKAAATTPRKRTPAKKSAPFPSQNGHLHPITAEQIALRAYYLAEKRQKKGVPGNANSDWLEAEAQLQTEAQAASVRSGP